MKECKIVAPNLTFGVLALQGAVSEHINYVQKAGAKAIAVKTIKELENCDALILPGGESTTISRLMHQNNLFDAIQSFAKNNPVLGTCAGMILMAQKIIYNDTESNYGLGLMDFTVVRNAFGRQVESFQVDLKIKELDKPFPSVFIRAPLIKTVNDPTIKILANHNDQIVMVQQNNFMACSFHPELTEDTRIIELFYKLCF